MSTHAHAAAPRAAFDLISTALPALGLAVLYASTFEELARTVWSTDEQGQGPAILAIVLWLLWRKRKAFAALPAQGAAPWGWLWFALALGLHWVGRTQGVLMFSAVSLIPLLAGLALIYRGAAGLKLVWFPLFFLLFMVPLPGPFVSAATTPLKTAVSWVAAQVLYAVGYPVARSGVVLMVGQYQLLVADACAGLTSMFTLEALGMLYMNLKAYTSSARNITLALLLVPVSFTANVIRVMLLIIVTYHFGDAAGQGFVHASAGVLLFVVAISLMMSCDRLLGLVFSNETTAP
jgi:exosortase B